MTPVAAAVAYAERGWPVFPVFGIVDHDGRLVCRCGRRQCGSPGKHPHRLVDGGFHAATTDPAQVRAWWHHDATANIGLAAGVAFDVLDVDHVDYVAGVAALPDCETAGGPIVETGSGKWHLYFAASGVGRRIRFVEHCDWLGEGGYVIAPPSRHIAGGHYRWWAPFTLALTAPPRPLLELLEPPTRHSPPTRPASPAGVTHRWSPDGLFGKMATAGVGQRNDVLHWCAARVGDDVRAGRVDHADADAALAHLASIAAGVGLGDREIAATIRSALRADGARR